MNRIVLYLLSIFISYVLFVVIGSLLMLAQIGVLGKGVIVILFGGLIYLPIFMLSNLTQFLLIKYPKRIKLAFFLPVVIIWLIISLAVLMNKMDYFIWKVMIPSQVIVSVIGYKLYKAKNVQYDTLS